MFPYMGLTTLRTVGNTKSELIIHSSAKDLPADYPVEVEAIIYIKYKQNNSLYGC